MTLKQLPISQYIPALREAGIDHVVGAAEVGVGVQVTRSIALAATGSPHTITFASLESQGGNRVSAPLGVDYIPVIVGNSAANVDLASRTLTSFQVVGGTDADVVAFVILGRFGSMKR